LDLLRDLDRDLDLAPLVLDLDLDLDLPLERALGRDLDLDLDLRGDRDRDRRRGDGERDGGGKGLPSEGFTLLLSSSKFIFGCGNARPCGGCTGVFVRVLYWSLKCTYRMSVPAAMPQ